MIGMRVKYNNEMTGTIMQEDATHVVIIFDGGSTFCVRKAGLKEKCFMPVIEVKQGKLF